MAPIRVLLVDDHTVLREGLRALLAAAPDLEVVGEASSGEEGIAKCAALAPHVVVMDVAMPGLGGLEATLAIRRAQPEVRVLVLTQHEDPEYVRRFLKAGVAGYLLKRMAGAALVGAIRSAARGGLVLDPDVARSAMGDPDAPPAGEAAQGYESLTDREKQILKLVAEGRSNKEVAGVLDISVKTAMTHREHLMRKLDVHNRTELVRFALRAGVIRLEP
ncbi:MAG: response regulator transcription factor [Vicinamibacterales bacterium]|nr:response regulator transcription factor [Vicinamibacterales bacterium]